MRHVTSCFVVLFLGVALVQAAPKKLEKKSVSDSLAPKAVEQVDQKLDAPSDLGDEALLQAADGQNVDRAKKQASTTFCVEIRQNKPTQVDCEEVNNRPMPPPEPEQPIIVPQHQPEQQPQINIEVQPTSVEPPCEPEIATYFVPTGSIVYQVIGNCPQHPPGLYQGPSAFGPSSLIPGGGGANPISVFHIAAGGLPTGGLPTGGLPAGGAGLPGVHVTPGAGVPGGFHSTLHPLHAHGAAGGLPSLHHHGLPSLHPHGRDGGHLSNEQLAMKFLSDLHKNLQPSGTPLVSLSTQGQSQTTNSQQWNVGSPAASGSSASGSPASGSSPSGKQATPGSLGSTGSLPGSQQWSVGSTGSPAGSGPSIGQPQWSMGLPSLSAYPGNGPQYTFSISPTGQMSGISKMLGPDARYMPVVRPMSNMQSQVMYQQQAASMGQGMHGMPMGTYGMGPMMPMNPMMTPTGVMPMMRNKADCLEDSFQTNMPMVQGIRLSRGPDEAEAKAVEQESPKPENEEEAKKKSQEESKEEAKKARLARYLMSDKDSQSNLLDE